MERAKKDGILAAASRAFARFGFKKASVEDIAREAGVAKGTVYLACESKEDLFYQAVHRELRAFIAHVAKTIDPRRPAEELMVAVGQAGLSYMDDHPLVRDLLLGKYHGAFPDWRERFEDLRALGRANAVEILRLGIRQGAFRSGIDVEEVAAILQDLQLATYMFHGQDDGHRAERFGRRIPATLDLILNGLRPRPGD